MAMRANRSGWSALAATCALMVPGAAHAAGTQSLPVKVSVDFGQTCDIDVTKNIAFPTPTMTADSSGPGRFNVGSVSANGEIVVQCSSGLLYKVFAPDNANQGNYRRMRSLATPFSYIEYRISSIGTNGTEFRKDFNSAASNTAKGYREIIPIYGYIEPNTGIEAEDRSWQTSPPVTSYVDDITFTVAF